jgi:hypothetical protein
MTTRLVALQVRTMTTLDRMRERREAGQGALEYVGMVAVAALVVVAILGLVSSWDIGGLVGKAVEKVKTTANLG